MFSLGAFLDDRKAFGVQRNAAGVIAFWLKFFALSSELMEAAESMDAVSYQRLRDELEQSVGTDYFSGLDRFCRSVAEATEGDERRYRLIAAACLEKMRKTYETLPRVLPQYDLLKDDQELDQAELILIQKTGISEFLAHQYVFRGTWLPKRLISSCWLPNSQSREAPSVALRSHPYAPLADTKRGDPQSVFLQDTVLGVRIEADKWLLRPGRFSLGQLRIRNGPPDAELFVPRDDIPHSRIAEAFQRNLPSKRRTAMCFHALDYGNVKLVTGANPFPNTSRGLPAEAFDCERKRIVAAIQPFDMLFSRDTTEGISTAIAALDGGSWSHCTMYMGDGLLLDADTPGTNVVPLDEYLQPKYRLALFRKIFQGGESPARTAAQKKDLADMARQQKGKPYNYIGAIQAGLHSAVFNNPQKLTPNALIRRGDLVPIVVA